MDQQSQQVPTPPATSTAASQPSEPPQQSPQQQPQPEQPKQLPPPSTATSTATPTTTTSNPNPNSNPPPPSKPTFTHTQPRPAAFSRPWQQQQQQQHPHFSHFSSLPSPSSSTPSSSVPSPISAPQRGGIAIGVPASRPTASVTQPTPPFSGSFGQQFGGLGRTGVGVPDSIPSSSALQARQQVQGMHGMGMLGSLGTSSQMRPGGISVQHHQQRPVQQSPLRSPSPSSTSQSPTQSFQGQGLMRPSQVGSPGSPAPSASQSMQSHNQPWLSSGPQGKPPLPPPSSFRPQMNSPSMQQRSHIPQQHIPSSTAAQQQHGSSMQPQQSKPSPQLQENYGQQFPSSRVSQSLSHQQPLARPQSSTMQKPSSLGTIQPNTVQPGTQSRVASAESDESSNRILSKRSIHELVNQIDPSESLDSEVEDILVDIAEDFVDSITTFGCSLAKHRKSDTLEAKDILLHLERNWNMTLPGFGGDEIKTYRKPLTNDIHKERLAVIKKSVSATEVANTRTSVGVGGVTAKSNLGKIPANS